MAVHFNAVGEKIEQGARDGRRGRFTSMMMRRGFLSSRALIFAAYEHAVHGGFFSGRAGSPGSPPSVLIGVYSLMSWIYLEYGVTTTQ